MRTERDREKEKDRVKHRYSVEFPHVNFLYFNFAKSLCVSIGIYFSHILFFFSTFYFPRSIPAQYLPCTESTFSLWVCACVVSRAAVYCWYDTTQSRVEVYEQIFRWVIAFMLNDCAVCSRSSCVLFFYILETWVRFLQPAHGVFLYTPNAFLCFFGLCPPRWQITFEYY